MMAPCPVSAKDKVLGWSLKKFDDMDLIQARVMPISGVRRQRWWLKASRKARNYRVLLNMMNGIDLKGRLFYGSSWLSIVPLSLSRLSHMSAISSGEIDPTVRPSSLNASSML